MEDNKEHYPKQGIYDILLSHFDEEKCAYDTNGLADDFYKWHAKEKERALREIVREIKNIDLEHVTGANFDLWDDFDERIEKAIDQCLQKALGKDGAQGGGL